MDNVTHSLIGVLVGKSLLARAPERSAEPRPAWQRAVLWSAVLASNFPDIDALVSKIDQGGQLGYLLDHRGYTHTIGFLPLNTLASAVLGLVIGFRGMSWVRDPARAAWSVLAALIGVALHVGADAWNEYGVHPFWPWSNQWHYGDFIFIVEPVIWFALLPMVFLQARNRIAKLTCATLALIMLGMAFSGKYLDWKIALALLGWAALSWAIQWRRWRPVACAWLLLLASLGVFFGVSRHVRARVASEVALARPGERIVQLAMAPAPANPFCWRMLTAGVDEDSYVARVGGISLLPGIFNPLDCPLRLRGERFAPLKRSSVPDRHGVAWVGEFRRPLAELRARAHENCGFASLLRFARIPFWMGEGKRFVGGDLRYDRGPRGGSFAVMEVRDEQGRNASGMCVSWPWEEPIREAIRP